MGGRPRPLKLKSRPPKGGAPKRCPEGAMHKCAWTSPVTGRYGNEWGMEWVSLPSKVPEAAQNCSNKRGLTARIWAERSCGFGSWSNRRRLVGETVSNRGADDNLSSVDRRGWVVGSG